MIYDFAVNINDEITNSNRNEFLALSSFRKISENVVENHNFEFEKLNIYNKSEINNNDNNNIAILIRNLSFSYESINKSTKPESLILNGINLTIPKCNIYGLLGSSGCGKTTLLKIILGRIKPKSGTISIFGEECNSTKRTIQCKQSNKN
jgi:ABC-type glutathione transport system ATPase component